MRCVVCNAYKVRKVITMNVPSDTVKYHCNKCDSAWEKDIKTGKINKIWKPGSFVKGD